ncbi:MAG: transposase [Mycobacterium sp.]
MIVSTEGVREKMPAAHPEEFRRRAVELARLREKPTAQIARDLGISESCLRRWMGQADIADPAGARADAFGHAMRIGTRP